MSRELYNEGRVQGLSAYEAYVKNALEEDPEAELASEREWLAASLAMGSSMLLRISADEDAGLVRDFKLPEESKLVAPSTIIASFFIADPNDFDESIFDYTGWVTQVGSYGDLLKNDLRHPDADATTYDYDDDSMDDAFKTRMMNYLRIQDGLVLQPGKWEIRNTEDELILNGDDEAITVDEDTGVYGPVYMGDNKPVKILKYPNFTEPPTVRIRFAREVTAPFFVLLTGFVDWKVLRGEAGIDGGAADTSHPYNGDFLGPELFPWANKIMFSTSTATSYQMQNALGAGSGNVHIETDPDSFETTITVDNDISSNSPYLTVEQTNDGGQTVLDLDTSGLLNDQIHEGVGITLSPEDTGIQVATNLRAGTGIYITDNMPTSTQQTIATNIIAGAGISTSTSNGALVISNTMASNSYTNLTTSSQYTYGVYNDGNYSTSDTYWIRWYNNFYAHSLSDFDNKILSDYPDNTRGTLVVQYSPSYSTDENEQQILTAATVKVSATNTYSLYHLGDINSSSSFQFRHSHDYRTALYDDAVPESRICCIVFPRNSSLVELSGENVSFTDDTPITNGIWNVQGSASTTSGYSSFGGSWPVRLSVTRDTSIWDGYSAYMITAVSIGDGYNSQYYYNFYNNYNHIRSDNLNISVQFTIRL